MPNAFLISDTAENLAFNNPALEANQIAVEVDVRNGVNEEITRGKIGVNGVLRYNDLPYAFGAPGSPAVQFVDAGGLTLIINGDSENLYWGKTVINLGSAVQVNSPISQGFTCTLWDTAGVGPSCAGGSITPTNKDSETDLAAGGVASIIYNSGSTFLLIGQTE